MLFGFDDPHQEQQRAPDDLEIPEVADAPDQRRGSRWLFAIVGIVAIAALVLSALALRSNDDALTQQDLDEAVAEALAAAGSDGLTAEEVFNQIGPSLVVVRGLTDDPDEPDSIGAGVVMNEQGQILTANHVISGADSLEVRFADGTVLRAQLDSAEIDRDIAVLRPAGAGGLRVPAVLGNPRTLSVGDPIFAVGNPLGLTGSLSTGVISGLDRDIPLPAEDGEELVLEDLIQFDAAVNQGSSGGPLLNSQGQVIGIVTALADPSGEGFFVGIGFAVPIDIAAGGAANGPSQ